MPISKDKRKKIESKVLETFKLLDPSLSNYKRYKGIFDSMSDTQFSTWFTQFAKDESENFYLEVMTYKNEPSLQDIMKTAKFLKLPLKERVTLNHLGGVKTYSDVPVGYLFLKRQQQIVSKKNSIAGNIKKRNMRTGQVTDKSKAVHVSDLENSAIQVIGADLALKELFGPRADSTDAKNEMYVRISNEGYFRTTDLPNNKKNKTTLNTVNVLFLGAGIKTNLVNNSLLLPISTTLVSKEEKTNKKRNMSDVRIDY